MRAVVLTVPVAAAELAADRLWQAGASAVEERTASAGRVELRTTLGTDDLAARSRLGALPPDWVVDFTDVDDEPADTWRRFAKPIRIGSELVICPAWIDPDASGATVVRIEPGGAFGLGDHPTTRLSAEVAHDVVRAGDQVLDVGCGSGVLSIVAALRGAVAVVAIDIAEAAREATVDNARRNGVADRIHAATTPIGDVSGSFDVVLANVLAPALVGMAADLRRLTAADGRLVVSGVLRGRHDHVVEALRPMQTVDVRDLDGWSAVTLRHQER